MKACVPNNEEAFVALYQRYEKRVFHYLMTVINDSTLAEETLVEVMLAIWKRAQLHSRDNLKPQHGFSGLLIIKP